jgi:hypothetical protein
MLEPRADGLARAEARPVPRRHGGEHRVARTDESRARRHGSRCRTMRQRALLTLLALNAGRAVTLEATIDAL